MSPLVLTYILHCQTADSKSQDLLKAQSKLFQPGRQSFWTQHAHIARFLSSVLMMPLFPYWPSQSQLFCRVYRFPDLSLLLHRKCPFLSLAMLMMPLFPYWPSQSQLLLWGSLLSRFVTAVASEVSFCFSGNADDASFSILAFAVSGKLPSFGTLLSVISWPVTLLAGAVSESLVVCAVLRPLFRFTTGTAEEY